MSDTSSDAETSVAGVVSEISYSESQGSGRIPGVSSGASSRKPSRKRPAKAVSEASISVSGGISMSGASSQPARLKKKPKRAPENEYPMLPLFEHDLKDGLIAPYRMWNKLPPSGLEGKLLPLPIDPASFCQSSEITTLEIEHRVPLVSELDHGCIIDMLRPEVYEVTDPEAVGTAASTLAEALKLHGRRKEAPEAGGFLRNTVHMPNDIHTLQEEFYTGHDGAEKRLRRNAPKPATCEEAMSRIEETFKEAQGVPVHPTKKVTPVHTSEIFPDDERFASDLVTVVFDEPPMKTGLDVPAFLIQHMPHDAAGASDLLEEPAANLESKDVFTAYVSRENGVTLDNAAEVLEAGDELSLQKGTCYVFDNRLANEAKKRAIGGYHDVTQLLLVRPAKRDGEKRPDGPTLYTVQSAPLENMRKHSTFGLGKLAAPEFAQISVRPPLPGERDHDSDIRRMLAGESRGKQAQESALIQEAFDLANKL